MKRFFIHTIRLFFVVCFITACESEALVSTDEPEGMNLSLTVGLGDSPVSARLPRSGATEDVLDSYHENFIDEVSCFFYPIGEETENAVFIIQNYSLKQEKTGTIHAYIPDDAIKKLFPNGNTTCLVYAVANHSFSFPLSSTKLSDIQKNEITSDFKGKIKGDSHDDNSRIQTKFVMDGQLAEVKVKDEGTTGSKKIYAANPIPLTRAAAKITLEVTVNNQITDEFGSKWESQPENMSLAFRHGLNKSYIGEQFLQGSDTDYFDTPGFSKFTKNATNVYSISVPYYSYSSNWKNNAKNEAYFYLVLPWAKVKDGQQKEYKNCYYQIPINPDGKKIARNTYYKLNLKVGILGDFKDDATPVPLTPSYKILDWGTENMDLVVGDSEYLMAEKNYVEMRDIPTFTMPYYTSDPLIKLYGVNIDQITYESYRKNNTETVKLTASNPDSSVGDGNTYGNYEVTWDDVTNQFTFTINPAVNSLAYYTIQHIDLTLKNESGLTDKVHIVWYPAIYIIGEESKAPVWVNEQKYDASNNDGKTQYVDMKYTYIDMDIQTGEVSTNKDQLGSVSDRSMITGTDGEINDNKNQYTVYASSLVRDSKFSIGDPRSKDPGIDGFAEGKGLATYLRTDPEANMMIAPIFKIASSFGKTTDVTYLNAHRRCASYQENGYPAGRWRVPTLGEIKFVIELSSVYTVIPSLFDGKYWCSKTDTYYNSKSTPPDAFTDANGIHAVRCVYDVWYWGDKKINELNSSHSNNDPHWSNQY